MWLEAFFGAIAGFLGGFISTLASNGSSITLPALDFIGFPEHAANGTNRLSVVALGLVGTISFWHNGLIDWREGGRIALVSTGLLVVLGLLLLRPGRWLGGRDRVLRPLDRRQAIGVYAGLVVLGSGFFMLAALVLLTGCDLRQGNAMKALILLVVGAQSLFIFDESGEVYWAAGVPLALGSGDRAYLATRARVYRFLVLMVIVSIFYLISTENGKFLQHT